MKVALVTHQFFPEYYTGVERLTLNLAGQLARMGHEPVVLTASERPAPYAFQGVRVRPLPFRRADLARPWRTGGGEDVRRVLDDERPDVVHVMHPMRLPAAFDAAGTLGLPVVAHVADFFHLCARVTMRRTDGSLCPGPDGGRACSSACGIGAAEERLAWARERLDGAGAVVAPTRFAIAAHAAEGFDTAGWERVPWGVDYALHERRLDPPRGDRLVLGFLGTLLEQKGPHLLVEALRRLPGRPVELRLYGESFHERDYERELRRLAAGDARISFPGRYEHEELPAILAELDAVAIPSLWHENLPTTGLNAVASGVPVLVSGVGGLDELVDDYRCGLRFRTGDPASVAALLERLLGDPDELAAVRRRMLYPPSLEEEAWRIEGVYDAVAAHAGAAA